MTRTVIMLPETTDDLANLYSYVARHDSIAHADMLLSKLEDTCATLGDNPQRGHVVPELKRIFVEGFREIHYKPYRVIFQIAGETVYVHAILDGRRELQAFLERRLLG
jgi:toxin ParE1/3/4